MEAPGQLAAVQESHQAAAVHAVLWLLPGCALALPLPAQTPVRSHHVNSTLLTCSSETLQSGVGLQSCSSRAEVKYNGKTMFTSLQWQEPVFKFPRSKLLHRR